MLFSAQLWSIHDLIMLLHFIDPSIHQFCRSPRSSGEREKEPPHCAHIKPKEWHYSTPPKKSIIQRPFFARTVFDLVVTGGKMKFSSALHPHETPFIVYLYSIDGTYSDILLENLHNIVSSTFPIDDISRLKPGEWNRLSAGWIISHHFIALC